MVAPEGCALAEEPPRPHRRPTRGCPLAGVALPSPWEAHTLGAVPLLFSQRRASARGAESSGDRASPGPGRARPGRAAGVAGLWRVTAFAGRELS